MEDVIRTAIQDALEAMGLPDASFAIEHPENLEFGDYACNVALVAGKALGKNPRELAQELASALEGQIEYVDRIEVAGPGFLNFHLAREFFAEEVARAIELCDSWGKNRIYEGKKVIVEYTDPNPFKEFHIGHMFTNSVGESIARLFMFSGADTKRVNYQGDVGLHVAHAIYGMQHYGITADKAIEAKDLGKAYAFGATAYKNDPDAQARIREINKKVYTKEDEEINALYTAGREASLSYFETIYGMLGTQFDEYFFESEAAPRGKELVISSPDIFVESDGARVFNGEAYGLHTRVFLNSEGLPTYEAKELALAKIKEERLGTYDLSIVSTSNEITEYFKVLIKAMSFVYPELASKTEHIGHGTVRLATGKMSSRTGDVIPAIDFIEAVTDAAFQKMEENGKVSDRESAQHVAVAAIKYATLRSNILQDSTFDRDQALSFEGNSGPYLQYTHARICSVLQKAGSLDMSASIRKTPAQPYELERILYRFPEVVAEAVAQRAPHGVATYLTELSSVFNSFYGREEIANPDDEYAPYKMALCEAVRQTLRNGLFVLGIQAPERM